MTLRCSLCGSRAFTRVRYSRLSLCRRHYAEFFERRVKNTVERYRLFKNVKRLLVCVSGGKDSVAMLYALKPHAEKRNVELLGLTIDLGIGEYSKRSVEAAVEAFKNNDVDYLLVDLSAEHGFDIDTVAENIKKLKMPKGICSYCGSVKRYIFNKAALDNGCDAVATGHNLDDLLSFTLTSMASGQVELLIKLQPKNMGVDKLVTRIRPLATLTNRETLLYVISIGASYVDLECPYSPGRSIQKTIVEKLSEIEYEHPGFKLALYKSLLRVLRKAEVKPGPLTRCEKCGMPSSTRICSFCRLKSLMTKKNTDEELTEAQVTARRV
ncbi:adenine nucleotide alpha hydrolase family protein [Candidatus Bathyarchaeota archaeon]|nr:adenine nucleotide alpha hydrolase family protein [Candidatus Bathyarchaeota archaeon]RJS74857.1 MAG: adenine nucleotide alpha hydrolase family protein [Candidatus Bathyarchaeota archaeon]